MKRKNNSNWLQDSICKQCGGTLSFHTSLRVDATRDGYPTGTCYRVCSKKCVTAYRKES
jgi:hypothetical protein